MSEYSPNRSSMPLVVAAVAVIAVAAVSIGFFLGRSSGDAAAPAALAGPAAPGLPAAPAPPEDASGLPAEVVPEEDLPQPAARPAATPAPGTRVRTASREPVTPAVEEPGEATAPADATEPTAPAEPLTVAVTVPAGTKIALELLDPVSSQTAAVGQSVRARVVETIRVDGRAAIPAGSAVSGRVTEVRALRKVGGQAHLALAFDTVELSSGAEPIEAYFARTGKSETGKDAATIAAGAVVGTILGNQARKNDRGKAIGAVVGAGVGTAIAASTEGEKVELAAGSVLELTLRSDVETVVRR